MDKLEKILAQTREQGLLRIVLIHHPPIPGTIKWRKRLIDGSAFVEVLARQGVELVLHGHAHYPIHSELQTQTGKAPVIGTPSVSALHRRLERLAKYHLYKLTRSTQGWSIAISVRRFCPEKAGFLPEEEGFQPLSTVHSAGAPSEKEIFSDGVTG
jgi:3',5'-cyclic AMP phosphodiesterase CpdA